MANSYGFSTAGLAEIEQQLQREEALTGRPASPQRRKALYEAYLSSQAQTAATQNIAGRQVAMQEQQQRAYQEALEKKAKGDELAGMIDIGKTAGKTGMELYDRKLLPTQGGYTDKLFGIGVDKSTGASKGLLTGASSTGLPVSAGGAAIGSSSGAFGASTLTSPTTLGGGMTSTGLMSAGGYGSAASATGLGSGATGTGLGAMTGSQMANTAAPGMGLGSMFAPAGWGMAGATGGKMLANALKVEDDAARAGMGIAGGAAAGMVAGGPIGAGIGAAVGGIKEAAKTVICTELHRQGILSDELYMADCKYACQHIDTETYDGYYVWARHIAKGMAKSEVLTAMVAPFGIAWAKSMAGEHNLIGDIILKIGVPICRFIGTHMIARETEVA